MSWLDLIPDGEEPWGDTERAIFTEIRDHIDDLEVSGGAASVSIFNVKIDYDAIGDDTANDTAAIQSAIDAADIAGGGIVYFPTGTYLIDTVLSLRVGVSLVGDGQLVSIIHQTDTAEHGVRLNNLAEAYTGISHLQFLGPGSGTGDGLHLDRDTTGDNQIALHLTDLLVQGFGNDAVYISGPIASTISRVVATTFGRDGFHLEKVTTGAYAGFTSSTFMNTYANGGGTGRYGYYIDDKDIGAYTSFISCAADSCDIGYNVTHTQNIGFYACGAEVCTTAGFKFASSRRVDLTSCFTQGTEGIDYWLASGTAKIVLTSCAASTAGSGHTAAVQVDSGAHAAIINFDGTASVMAPLGGGFIFTGKVVYIDDGDVNGDGHFGTNIVGNFVSYTIDPSTGNAPLCTGATTSTVTDSTQSWPTNCFAGAAVVFLTGSAAFQTRYVASNTGTVITTVSPFTGTPATGDQYQVVMSPTLNNLVVTDVAGSTSTTALVGTIGQTTSKRGFGARVAGDLEDRVRIRSDGNIGFGSGAASTDAFLYRTAANVLTTDGNLTFPTAGSGILLKARTGSTPGTIGEATLVGGTIAVTNTACTSTSYILLTVHTIGGTPGTLSVAGRSTSGFTINSSNAADTSSVFYLIINPA